MVKAGRVRKGDGNDVDHIKPIVKGGNTGRANLRVRTDNANRSFPRTRRARMR